MSNKEVVPLSVSFETTGVKVAIPLIADGTMAKFQLEKIEGVADEAGTMIQIKFTCKTVDPTPTSEGGQLQPGFPVFVTAPLRVKDGGDEVPEWAIQKIASIQDCVLGTGDVGNTKGKPERPPFGPDIIPQMIGKEFIAKVKVVKSKVSDYVGNDLGSFTFPADANV